MKQIIIFPKGTLSPKDRERITKAGALAIEADDPSKIVVALPNAPVLTDSDITAAALHALSSDRTFGSTLALRFLDKIEQAFKARTPKP